jgi:hypothetical protein
MLTSTRRALSYVLGSDPGALEHLSGVAGLSGAAVLYALRPIAAGEELLISYRDATATGALLTEESLRNYGFLSFANAPADAGAGEVTDVGADDAAADDTDATAAVDDDDDEDAGFNFAGGAAHDVEEAEERASFAALVDAVLAAPGGVDLSADQLLQVGTDVTSFQAETSIQSISVQTFERYLKTAGDPTLKPKSE